MLPRLTSGRGIIAGCAIVWVIILLALLFSPKEGANAVKEDVVIDTMYVGRGVIIALLCAGFLLSGVGILISHLLPAVHAKPL